MEGPQAAKKLTDGLPIAQKVDGRSPSRKKSCWKLTEGLQAALKVDRRSSGNMES